MIKKVLMSLVLLMTFSSPVLAQLDLDLEASESAIASESADASKSAIAKVVEKKPDITEPEGEVSGKLEEYLMEKKIGDLRYNNFLQHAIRKAVDRGVPANTIVLMILFPVVAAVIAASRHLFGLRGFGIFTPAVLSVAFVATGLVSGILVFLVILLVASIGRMILKKMKLHYLPRMALLLWFVSLGVFGLMFLSSFVELEAVVKLNIFLLMIKAAVYGWNQLNYSLYRPTIYIHLLILMFMIPMPKS